MRNRKRGIIENIFSDLLFNVLTVILIILVLAIHLINPVARDATVKKNANFIIKTKWGNDIDCDVDMWVAGPGNEVVYFGSKTNEYMHIERDDLGNMTDTWVKNSTGVVVKDTENSEIWTLRSKLDGEYTVNIHLYSCRTGTDKGYNNFIKPGKSVNVPVDINIVRVNPSYRIEYKTTATLRSIWEEKTVAIFKLSEDTLWFNLLPIVHTPMLKLKERNNTQSEMK